MEPVEQISNPVLTARDVTDVDAGFVADPFMISVGGEMAHVFRGAQS